MRKRNLKSNNNNLFKYSILISLNYYNIPYHREKPSKLDLFANKYCFSDTNPDIFEKNNPHVSLAILDDDDDNKLIYKPDNDSINQVYIVKINQNRYAPIKPTTNNLIKITQLIKKLSPAELKEILIYLIKYYDHQQLSKVLMDMIKNNILLESE